MIRIPITSLMLAAVVSTSAAATAQNLAGQFVSTAIQLQIPGGLFLVDPIAGKSESLKASGPLLNSFSLHCDPYEDDIIWIGTRPPTLGGPPEIYRVTATGKAIRKTTQIIANLANADSAVWQLQVLGHELLFLTDTQLSLLPLAGGKPRVLMTFKGTNGIAHGFACDGRFVYLQMAPNVAVFAEHVLRVDLEQLTSRSLVYRSASVLKQISGVSFANDGNLLIVEQDSVTASATLEHVDITNAKVLHSVKLPFDSGSAAARMDPLTSFILVGGRNKNAQQKRILSGFVTVRNWKIFRTEFGTSPQWYRNIGVRRPLPLRRFGHACTFGNNTRPDISASGFPTPGTRNYQIRLQGLANSPGLLLIGLHGGQKTPIQLSFIGAGSCQLGVQTLASLGGFRIGVNGTFSMPAPIPQAVGPVNLDLQFLIADATANKAGFVSSQVGSIAIR